MPHCPKCNAEVDEDQAMCAWCGFELKEKQAFTAPSQVPATEEVRDTQTEEVQATETPTADVPESEKAPEEPTPEPVTEVSQEARYGISDMLGDARELGKIGDYEGAGEIFERVLEQQPEHHEALFGLGAVHFRLHEYQEATHWWHKLSMICPEYPKIDMWLRKSREAHAEEVDRPDSVNVVPAASSAPASDLASAEAKFAVMPSMAVQIGLWLICLVLAGLAAWMLVQD